MTIIDIANELKEKTIASFSFTPLMQLGKRDYQLLIKTPLKIQIVVVMQVFIIMLLVKTFSSGIMTRKMMALILDSKLYPAV